MAVRESSYQSDLIKKLKELFPGCVVFKNDTAYMQGIPDLLVLYKHHWAALEVKASPSAPIQPNQVYYVRVLNRMSFAAFINPENEEDILDALQQAFTTGRTTRVSECE